MKRFLTFAFMDSLTQIVLGAACGEIALGKKIGNKALLFGAIGGTIPDLDVILGSFFYPNEIDNLAFHRGFMHSILFSLIGSLVIGFVVSELYDTGKRKGSTDLLDWVRLFFLSIFTHPILDSFTPYGTQLFLPFTDYRVAFNNISVADPLYTLPFLFCLLVVLFFKRSNPKRMKWTKAGIYISSFYLLITLGNKLYIDSIFRKSLEKANIEYSRFSAQPTLLNNVLWYSIAEGKENYYASFYSIFDRGNVASKFIKIPKNHDFIDIQHPDIQTLRWFSKDYYALYKSNITEQLIYKDLRYPLLNEKDINSSLFSFGLVKENDRWNTINLAEEQFREGSPTDYFKAIFERAFRDF